MTIDINQRMGEYGEAVRHLWNIHFAKIVDNLKECSPLDEFVQIDRLLFEALVSNPSRNQIRNNSFGREPISWLRFRLRTDYPKFSILTSDDNGRTWIRHEFQEVGSEELTGSFIEYFDWNRYAAIRPYYFVRGVIQNCRSASELVGRQIVIEAGQVEYFISV